jgi:hypothetical protein
MEALPRVISRRVKYLSNIYHLAPEFIIAHIPYVILQYANSDEIGDVADIRYAVRRQLFLEAN